MVGGGHADTMSHSYKYKAQENWKLQYNMFRKGSKLVDIYTMSHMSVSSWRSKKANHSRMVILSSHSTKKNPSINTHLYFNISFFLRPLYLSLSPFSLFFFFFFLEISHFSLTHFLEARTRPSNPNITFLFCYFSRKNRFSRKIVPGKMQQQRLKQQQQALMQQALLQQQSLYHPGLLAPPQVPFFSLSLSLSLA